MASKSNFNYQTRLFLIIIVFTWVLTFAFFTFQYTREKEYKVESLNSKLQQYNVRLLDNIYRDGQLDKKYIADFARKNSLRFTVIGFDGNVKYDTNGDSLLNNHKYRKEFTESIEKGEGYTICRLSESDSRQYFYSATKGDSVVVRSALPYNNSLYDSLRIDSVYMWIIIFMAITVSIIAYFASKRIGQIIENLSKFAAKAESGEIQDNDAYIFPQDELGDISRNIINLYNNLKKTAQERDENLKNAIFEEQEKVRIKHQLTNNINHEIKTPVHAIQACLETIVSNKEKLDKETIISLIDKAYQNVTRLCSLLHDISIITRISEASALIKKTTVNINEILDEIKSEISIYPIEKQMRLNVNVPEGVTINGNESLVESIFHNLVSNSIYYSGGRDIFIELVEDTEDFYKFRFYDNGVGVDENHLLKLFERFYRVDEGRSRKMGGTGLGLSIVKNAVTFHQGVISVKNNHTGGLEFTFTLHK